MNEDPLTVCVCAYECVCASQSVSFQVSQSTDLCDNPFLYVCGYDDPLWHRHRATKLWGQQTLVGFKNVAFGLLNIISLDEKNAKNQMVQCQCVNISPRSYSWNNC